MRQEMGEDIQKKNPTPGGRNQLGNLPEWDWVDVWPYTIKFMTCTTKENQTTNESKPK